MERFGRMFGVPRPRPVPHPEIRPLCCDDGNECCDDGYSPETRMIGWLTSASRCSLPTPSRSARRSRALPTGWRQRLLWHKTRESSATAAAAATTAAVAAAMDRCIPFCPPTNFRTKFASDKHSPFQAEFSSTMEENPEGKKINITVRGGGKIMWREMAHDFVRDRFLSACCLIVVAWFRFVVSPCFAHFLSCFILDSPHPVFLFKIQLKGGYLESRSDGDRDDQGETPVLRDAPHEGCECCELFTRMPSRVQ